MRHYINGATASVDVIWHRTRCEQQNYLLTACIGIKHSHESGGVSGAAYPQARAVVDDFGTLVIVEAWR